MDKPTSGDALSRRGFLLSAAAVSGAMALAGKASAEEAAGAGSATAPKAAGAHAGGSDVIKVGIIGAGGRGTGAAENCIEAAPNTVIVAIGDAFADRADAALEKLSKLGDRCKATKETTFSGVDAYKQVLATDCDMVILAAPPGFRPTHFKAAVEAGKHIFTEKPVAVDPIGIRSFIESAEQAKAKKLSVIAGTQRRHHVAYNEIIKRIKDGAIGEILFAEAYWCMGGLWVKERKPEWSDMEWQMRNWLYFDWASGDHIVEQHVHNLDVINWIMGGPPVKCVGVGGRQWRTDRKYGNVYDHFSVEYEYANGARVMSVCRQTEGAYSRVGEWLSGTKGSADPSSEIKGASAYKWEGEGDPGKEAYVNEHKALIKSIMDGAAVNEGKQVAESCLTAIMGRMSAYTGQQLSYNWVLKASKLDLSPAKIELADNRINPVPIPGETKLV